MKKRSLYGYNGFSITEKYALPLIWQIFMKKNILNILFRD